MYNYGERVAVAIIDGPPPEVRGSLQNAVRVDQRTALVNENIRQDDIATTVNRQGRETSAVTTQERIDAVTPGAAPFADAAGQQVGVESIGESAKLIDRVIQGSILTATDVHVLQLARASIGQLISMQTQLENMQRQLAARTTSSTPDTQKQLEDINAKLAQIKTELSKPGSATIDQIDRAINRDATHQIPYSSGTE